MNYKIKEFLRSWERNFRYQMPQGGKMTLSFILEEEHDRACNNPTGVSMPEFLENINPCLYPLFIIDWTKVNKKRIPTKFKGDSIAFLRDVMGEWLKECGKKSYFTDGMFSSFENVKQVEESIEFFTDDNLRYIDEQQQVSLDYVDMEFRMGERQLAISKQRKLEEEKAQEERELEEKAQRKREDAERKAAKEAAEATVSKVSEGSPRGTTAPSIDQLMLEAQQLFDQSPLPKAVLQLYVRPADTAEPYTAELVWDNTGHKKGEPNRPSDIFTGPSFPIVIAKAKTHVSGLIDELINEQQKEKQRQAIQQQIDDQNTAFEKQMAESQRMLRQMQDMIAEQQRKHEAAVSQLQQQITCL